MTVKELKRILDRFEDSMEVVVQFRDDGGDYSGADRNVYFGVAYASGGNYDSYDNLVYGESDEGKKVVVL